MRTKKRKPCRSREEIQLLREQEPPLCKCGCGERVLWDKKNCKWMTYVKNHQNIGRKHSLEVCAKLSMLRKGKKQSEEHIKKRRESLCQFKNTGLTIKQYSKYRHKMYSGMLSDTYVKHILCQQTGLKHIDIPDELVAAKREHLRLGRLLRGL